MTQKSNFSRPMVIPRFSSAKSKPLTVDYTNGISTMKPNEEMKLEDLRVAQDARMERVGEYKTRKGCNLFTDAIGKTSAIDNLGDNDITLPLTDKTIIKQPFTPTSDFRLWQVDLSLSKPNGVSGV